ncbi:MAG: hypothetical protein IBX67_08065 [Dehalococcoidia bacterium]|nr:hypothetical protein [Dehalococcoidia bacterium]
MAYLLLGPIIRVVLPVINKVHRFVAGIKPLPGSSILCVEVKRHRGDAVKLDGGCVVRPGDPVIKLHLNSDWIARRWRSSSGTGMKGFPQGLIYYFREGLRLLAAEVDHGEYSRIVAVYGWTAFHVHAGRLGFQVIDLPDTLRIRMARLHIAALMQAHHVPWLRRHATFRSPLTVKAVWLSRADLLKIHGSSP